MFFLLLEVSLVLMLFILLHSCCSEQFFLNSHTRQPVPVPHHPYCKKLLPYIQSSLLYFSDGLKYLNGSTFRMNRDAVWLLWIRMSQIMPEHSSPSVNARPAELTVPPAMTRHPQHDHLLILWVFNRRGSCCSLFRNVCAPTGGDHSASGYPLLACMATTCISWCPGGSAAILFPNFSLKRQTHTGCLLNFGSEGTLLLSQQIMDIVGFLKSQFICHLLICYIFIVSGLIINFIQLFTLILWPINKQLFRKINCRLAYCISSQMVMLLEWWSGTDCTLYTDPESYHKYGKENAIVILNHNFEIDFLCGWNFCERFGVLGSSKVLAKKELSYMPIIGWMWYFLEIVFCKRKWEEDRKTVMQKLLNLRDYPENFWFLIHCEGTRFTEQKHQASMQVAEAKGLPKLKYHLLPRTKGFAVTVQCLRNVVSAVYDSTLNFRNNENPTLLGVLNGKKYHADLYVRRIPLEEIPEDEQECSNWLHRLYQEKDAFQEEYYRTGTYPAVPIVPPRRPWTLLNWLFWASLLLYPLFKLLVNMINSGSSLTLASFGFVIVMASVGVRWMIGVTEINKGSTYGNNDNKQKQK
uniref:1-acyl-sn-glycerol-3-phosphate acyltransferase delta n=3 Tax=Meleagris gallopavo TaxID=9103 RepID=G1NIC7_MELGA